MTSNIIEDNEGEYIRIRKELVVAYFTGQEKKIRGIRRKQLLFDLKEKVRYCNLREERLRCTVCRLRFAGG